MARQVNNLFLEEWLRNSSGSDSNTITSQSSVSSPSSSRAIIQAWAELRDCLQHKSFQSNHLQSLKVLLSSRISLHVADPQAKLLLSILSFQDIIIPLEAYPLMIRLLYIWVRKSFRPSLLHIDLAVEVLSKLFGGEYGSRRTPEFFSEGVLILGALSFVPSISEKSRTVCLDLLCRLIIEDLRLVRSFEELVPDILAGIGYALCSSDNVYYVRLVDAFFGMWEVEDGLQVNVTHGLMILHLVEWVISGFIKANSQKRLVSFAEVVLESSKGKYGPFALIMASGGSLRALNKQSGHTTEIVSRLRVSSENLLESVARGIISKTSGFSSPQNDPTTSLLLTCMSLALTRGGSVSARPPFLISLASALLMEIFPLKRVHLQILEPNYSLSAGMGLKDIKKHLNSVSFREAGVITGVFCNQYVSTDEESKVIVENMMWKFCQELYLGHRQAALLLRESDSELLGDMEKVAESAFLMVVVFALAVTKHKLNPKLSNETQLETSVAILISFSCVEYFRRIRLPEYLETIRGVVISAQENETACISFVESMPSYVDITKPQDLIQKMEYTWFKDDMQTARILFYLRVIPTCIERLPLPVFSRVVAPTMFLYLGHPNRKVAQASHSLFAAFMSSGKSSDENERASLKEQLSFYYTQRSLEGYPSITPFEGMASGIVALVRNVPAGCPAAFYCIHSLVEKAQSLCSNDSHPNADIWKNWSGETGPSKKILELLLRLISLVDIQVLPNLMKLLAQLIIQLPKVGQIVVLNELYVQVAESDDVTRKPALVSWLQSLSYLSHQVTSRNAASKGIGNKERPASSHEGSSSWDGMSARL